MPPQATEQNDAPPTTDPKNVVKAVILQAGAYFAADLNALPETELSKDHGGRSPFDVAYEVVLINRRFAARFRQVEPDALPDQKWITAPSSFCVKDLAVQEIRESTKELAEAWDALGDEAMTKRVPTSSGADSALSLAIFAAKHIAHHDGQLTMTQWMIGDHENHWS